jgi:DNA repair protein RecN (Recombination protein N)
MLSELVVEGLGVIDRAEITLDRGCCALTGETGAGKTLVVAALSLLLGDRADRTLVREGAAEARVEGRFVVARSHPAVALLRAHGILPPDESHDAGDEVELVLARSVAADGRTRPARVNGRLVTVALLDELGGQLVEIAGQHTHARLTSPSVQRALLDAFAGEATQALAAEVADAVGRAVRAEREAAALRSSERERRRELDLLNYEISEIEGAAPQPGESDRLRTEAQRLENAEVLATGIHRALAALRDEGGAGELIDLAQAELGRLVPSDPRLHELAGRLESIGHELADVGNELVARMTEPDPGALDEVRGRLATLARLARKYGDDERAVLEYLQRSRSRASDIDSLDERLEAVETEAAEWRARATELARRLSQNRRAAAPRLERAMEQLLGELALPGARFEVVLNDCDSYEGGAETVEYRVSANAGEPPRPLAKVASGGELSRISLALHLSASSGTAETMVFDEVDAGVGGAGAQAVGRALADLAARTSSQVVVVTHLPQVAVFADRHLRVTKSAVGGRMTAVVEEVGGEGRVAELSRMLAGLPESKRARDHAKELLDLASGKVGAG